MPRETSDNFFFGDLASDSDESSDSEIESIDYPSDPDSDSNDSTEAFATYADADADDTEDTEEYQQLPLRLHSWKNSQEQQLALIQFTTAEQPTAELLAEVDATRSWPHIQAGNLVMLNLLSYLAVCGLDKHIAVYQQVHPITLNAISVDGRKSALAQAILTERVDIAKQLLSYLADDERVKAISANGILQIVVSARQEVYEHFAPYLQSFRFLLDVSGEGEYPHITQSIEHFINDIKQRRSNGVEPKPVFVLTDDDWHKILCIIHYSIRRSGNLHASGSSSISSSSSSSISAASYLDIIEFLMSIDGVKARCLEAFLTLPATWMMELVTQYRCRSLFNQLIQLPAVVTQASEHRFYLKDEFSTGNDRGWLGLAGVASHSESSMAALSAHEKSALAKAQTYYLTAIDAKGGVDKILTEIRVDARQRYNLNPVTVTLDGTNMSEIVRIPFEWDGRMSTFKAMLHGEFSGVTIRQACRLAREQVHRHKAHAAYRYLSDSNPFKASHARDTAYKEHKYMIALFYVAAGDESMPSSDGSPVADRLTLFFEQLALQQRAHNRDDGPDDGQADETTCSSGTRKRLLQSVLNHPLFIVVTHDVVMQALREKIWHHYLSVVTDKNCMRMHQLIEVIAGDEDDAEQAQVELSRYDINEASRSILIDAVCDQLAECYGEDFSRKELQYRLMMQHYLSQSPLVFNCYMDANIKSIIDRKMAVQAQSMSTQAGIFTRNKRSFSAAGVSSKENKNKDVDQSGGIAKRSR